MAFLLIYFFIYSNFRMYICNNIKPESHFTMVLCYDTFDTLPVLKLIANNMNHAQYSTWFMLP